MEPKKFKRVNLVDHEAEHLTLMSFYDDDGNYAFREWWDEIGSQLFNEWVIKHPEYSWCGTP